MASLPPARSRPGRGETSAAGVLVSDPGTQRVVVDKLDARSPDTAAEAPDRAIVLPRGRRVGPRRIRAR